MLVSLIGSSFLSEVERPSILRTGVPFAPSLFNRVATRPLGSCPREAGWSGATSCAANPARSAYGRFLVFYAPTAAGREGSNGSIR
jgi:hypothetical protein